MCIITEAFLTIAQAQQRALGYPDLPFVMLEHPVAVATDTEVEHKVAMIYDECVEKLTGDLQAAPGLAAPVSQPVAMQQNAPHMEALAPLRNMLKHDGADLQVTGLEASTLHVQLLYLDGVCVDCLPEHVQLCDMIHEACQAAGAPITTVLLDDPRQP